MIQLPAYFTAWILHVVLLMVAALQSRLNGRLILVETEDNVHGMIHNSNIYQILNANIMNRLHNLERASFEKPTN